MGETDSQLKCPCCHRPVDEGTNASRLVRTWNRLSWLFMLGGLGFAIVGVVFVVVLEWVDTFYVLGMNGIFLSAPFVVLWGQSRAIR